MTPYSITPFDLERDSFEEVTDLLHLAYGFHIDKGVTFGAATQGVEKTRRRIKESSCSYLARVNGRIVGVISYYDHRRYLTEPEWYERADVGHFAQFAVNPELQCAGIGQALLEAVEERALADGKVELSCDTATAAAGLVAYYGRKGYREVGTHQWRNARHSNVVLSKQLERPSRQAAKG